MVYAVLGPRGTFSEEAAGYYWGNGVELQVAGSISEVFSLVESGRVDGALVPIENSLAGTIHPTFEGLQNSEVWIKGEFYLPVQQHLLACRTLPLEEVELLISQPVVLMQCESFIKESLNGVRTEICDSTARAAQILRGESKRAVSIGNSSAATLYDLKIIYPDIAEENNITRFIHIGKPDQKILGDKSSIIFSLRDRPGALYDTLGIFARRGLNLGKIESRPSRKHSSEFSFYIEVDLSYEAGIEELLGELCEHCQEVKFLGSYAKQMEAARIDITESEPDMVV